MKLEDMWFASSRKDEVKNDSLGAYILPPSPPPKRIEDAKILFTQIMDWVRAGNSELEANAWKSLAEFADKQGKKPLK